MNEPTDEMYVDPTDEMKTLYVDLQEKLEKLDECVFNFEKNKIEDQEKLEKLDKRVGKLENFVETLCEAKLADIDHDLEAVDEDIEFKSAEFIPSKHKFVEELEEEKTALEEAKKRYMFFSSFSSFRDVKTEVTAGRFTGKASKRSRRTNKNS